LFSLGLYGPTSCVNRQKFVTTLMRQSLTFFAI
jgi:hypothetical protein